MPGHVRGAAAAEPAWRRRLSRRAAGSRPRLPALREVDVVLPVRAGSVGAFGVAGGPRVPRTHRIPFDPGPGGGLAGFFGAGLVLKSWIGGSGTAGIDRYLF